MVDNLRFDSAAHTKESNAVLNALIYSKYPHIIRSCNRGPSRDLIVLSGGYTVWDTLRIQMTLYTSV